LTRYDNLFVEPAPASKAVKLDLRYPGVASRGNSNRRPVVAASVDSQSGVVQVGTKKLVTVFEPQFKQLLRPPESTMLQCTRSSRIGHCIHIIQVARLVEILRSLNGSCAIIL
jgi:hypothetical protein